MLFGSFSVNAWKGVTPVPGGSPPVAPRPVLAVAPNPPAPNPVLVVVAVPPPPKRLPPVVPVAPNPGLAALLPKRPPVVLLPLPNAEVVLPAPNPPKVEVFVWAVLFAPPPNSPVVPVVPAPNAGLLPKALFAVLPKPPPNQLLAQTCTWICRIEAYLKHQTRWWRCCCSCYQTC